MTYLVCEHEWAVVNPCPECGTAALTDYEAAVDALAYYVQRRDAYHDCANDAPNWRKRCNVAKARAVLARLRPDPNPFDELQRSARSYGAREEARRNAEGARLDELDEHKRQRQVQR